jgi:hypothetical protein
MRRHLPRRPFLIRLAAIITWIGDEATNSRYPLLALATLILCLTTIVQFSRWRIAARRFPRRFACQFRI